MSYIFLRKGISFSVSTQCKVYFLLLHNNEQNTRINQMQNQFCILIFFKKGWSSIVLKFYQRSLFFLNTIWNNIAFSIGWSCSFRNFTVHLILDIRTLHSYRSESADNACINSTPAVCMASVRNGWTCDCGYQT